MPYCLEDKLVIGISSRALFEMSLENEIFETQGLEAYCQYQIDHEKEPLKPGPGFSLVKAFLELNKCTERDDRVEVIIMSQNRPDIAIRIFHSIEYYHLDIGRSIMVSGDSLVPYLKALNVDLFLSADENNVQSAIDNGLAAGIIYTQPQNEDSCYPKQDTSHIRIAFDGDAVIFTDKSERLFKQAGIDVFYENEKKYANEPLEPGPFARFLQRLSQMKDECSDLNEKIRLALVTARQAPAHERVIKTLRSWGVKVDEAFFLGGIEKKVILKAFEAQIFFDDQRVHTDSAALVVPSARVPYVGGALEL